ncbi:inositol monophosphatase family protein [Buchnera aphidicola]|uniref:Inositol-1-monophosphatase n=1 Tax=Buchnera aphidicola subsp. Melaphis rhois TaxID=118103 RepID=A0A4D6Y300_BUCMH|nr:inositol monophosphatase family protein [Buchnera aphidicola]QCI23289.1 inositol monophosphatase [Buchnera aphidicola (Melaphis rhois)]
MHPILNIAIRVARKGGNILIQNYDNQKINNDKQIKKQDLIVKMVEISEKLMINIIQKSYPKHIIITKNSKNVAFNMSEIVWLINALDGISNFERNLPHFCVSIAVIIRNITEISVIYDPLRNELFTSVKGQGAQLNGYRMRCNEISSLRNSLIGIIFSYSKCNKSNDIMKVFDSFLIENIKLRSTGCTNLDYSYIAIGRLDFLFNFNIKPFKITSGILQVKEAGGLISDVYGGNNYFALGSILAGNPKLMRIVLTKIRKYVNSNDT